MSTLNELVATRVAKLVRTMLGSDFDGEILSAARRLNALLKAEGLTHHDIATVIENANGEIEEKKYSDTDAKIIFERGVEKGRKEEAHKRELPPDYYDADGRPQWHPIALYCQKHRERLKSDNERQFVDDMADRTSRTYFIEPTPRQADWLLGIFIRLGGKIRKS